MRRFLVQGKTRCVGEGEVVCTKYDERSACEG